MKIYFVLKFSNILKSLNGFGKLNKFKSLFSGILKIFNKITYLKHVKQLIELHIM